jgi:hypothetical protein
MMTGQNGHGRAVPPRKNQPLKGLPLAQRQQLGYLLAIRRGELGYGDRERFRRERTVDGKPGWRTFTDLEMAYRDTQTASTIAMAARAYEVTYESVVAVARGEADALTPLGSRPAPPPPADSFSALEEIHPDSRPAVRERLPEVQAMIRTARLYHPEGPLRGAWVFGDGTPEQRFWDAMAAQGAGEAELAVLVAFGWAWDAAKAQAPRHPG